MIFIYEALESLEYVLADAFEKQGYTINREQMVNNLYIDGINGDIPFFTEYQGKVYNGFTYTNEILGERT